MPSPQQARAQASAITAGNTAPEAGASPTSQLRELFDGPRLSPGHRRIAQYLIEHITEAAFLSITDLAERVGVELAGDYRAMTPEPRSGDLLPEHLVAQQKLNGEGA